MPKRIVSTDEAPKAIGAYSQAVVAEEQKLVFCSGQIPIVPETGELLDGDIEEQTELVMKNLKAVLEAAGSGLDRVIKVTAFLADMSDFPEFNQVYSTFFTADPPARAAVEVARLPKDVLIEVEAVALVE
jgi:2-iminobutanoate/2-iminopropanoate deaminase